jgi:hypothetical protein
MDMGHMMQDEEVEDREEDEESVGEEEGREREGVRGMRRKWKQGGEELEVGEGGYDEDCERETPPPPT